MDEWNRILNRLQPELNALNHRIAREGGGHDAFMELGLQRLLVVVAVKVAEEKLGVPASPSLSHGCAAEPVPVSGKAGIANADTYRGWSIHQGRWPEPAWMATGPNYDAWTEGEGEWRDNGEKADAPTRPALIAEIDAWFEEHGND